MLGSRKVFGLARDAGVEAKDIETSTLRMGADYSEEKVPKFLGYEVSANHDNYPQRLVEV